MKTAVTKSSLRAWDNLPVVKSNTELIFIYFLANGPATRRECAMRLDLETSTVSARVNELIHQGRLERCGETMCKVMGSMVEAIRVPPIQLALL